jgi:hypothetical protein
MWRHLCRVAERGYLDASFELTRTACRVHHTPSHALVPGLHRRRRRRNATAAATTTTPQTPSSSAAATHFDGGADGGGGASAGCERQRRRRRNSRASGASGSAAPVWNVALTPLSCPLPLWLESSPCACRRREQRRRVARRSSTRLWRAAANGNTACGRCVEAAPPALTAAHWLQSAQHRQSLQRGRAFEPCAAAPRALQLGRSHVHSPRDSGSTLLRQGASVHSMCRVGCRQQS